MPALLGILDDEANPRVQAHGAAALVNFCEECPKHILVQYLDAIIVKLEAVLNNKFKEVGYSIVRDTNSFIYPCGIKVFEERL